MRVRVCVRVPDRLRVRPCLRLRDRVCIRVVVVVLAQVSGQSGALCSRCRPVVPNAFLAERRLLRAQYDQ